jgi:hypothetical protein
MRTRAWALHSPTLLPQPPLLLLLVLLRQTCSSSWQRLAGSWGLPSRSC